MKLTFVSDPAHGWLEVPLNVFHKFISEHPNEKFTAYSYVGKRAVYLEEDVDAPHFLDIVKDVKITERQCRGYSRIRNMNDYSLHNFCVALNNLQN